MSKVFVRPVEQQSTTEEPTDGHGCPFEEFGCDYNGEVLQVKRHLKETPNRHLSHLCDGVQELLAGTRQTQLYLEHQDRELEALCFRIRELDVMFSSHLIWRIDTYKYRLQEAKIGKRVTIFSPPFFTGKQGYKLAASAALFGDGEAKGSHMSFFLTIIRSDWDSLLQWPFGCKVTVTLVDQRSGEAENRSDIVEILKPNTCKENRPFLGRPVGDRNPSFGLQKFANLNDIEEGDYIRDDAIFVKVQFDTSEVHTL